jgi:AmmeMemoRadiSam system protein B/AmmeMemoRadiSam system protein A
MKFILILITLWLAINPASAFFADVRKPAVAGMFYPDSEFELSTKIDKYLNNVQYQRVEGNIIALVVPHAGYDYSGQIAAYAYKELEGKKFKRVILIGASHFTQFDGISVGEYDYYETPLGRVKVDREFAGKLVDSSPRISFLPEAHKREHSLEVQLPFLKKTLGNDFQIVPILFGNPSLANCQLLAMALGPKIDDETLIICSSDWSHYHDYATAVTLDKKAISSVVKGDTVSFVNLLQRGEGEACGVPAVITTLILAPNLGANKTTLLQYENSGDVTGDKTRVVGYAAIAFTYEYKPLSIKEKKKLLKVAREALKVHMDGKETKNLKVDGVLAEKRGAFVTLNKRGKLRGCIGYIQPHRSLATAVQEMAIAAATRDARFKPVTKKELKHVDIEISVLSRLEKVEDISEIKIGHDGLYIIAKGSSGLLLPQVATDQKWGRDEFLENVCYKARLPKDAWKDKDARLYRFSAEVFQE